jgi:tetratricopeptide (TPR) repeat protein
MRVAGRTRLSPLPLRWWVLRATGGIPARRAIHGVNLQRRTFNTARRQPRSRAMISTVPNTSAPIGGRGDFDGPHAPQGEEVPAGVGAAPTEGSGDALAKFGAEHGLHADVQQLAHPTTHAADGTASTDVQKARAQTLMQEGVKLLMERKYDAAIAKFEAGYKLFPSPNFLLNLGSTLRDAGRYAEAMVKYQEFLQADPQSDRAAEVRATMAETQKHLGGKTYTAADIAEAKRLIDEGTTAYREGRFQDAFNAWGEAYEHNPLPALLQSQGTCMERLGANYTAARLFRDYANADPRPLDAAEFAARADRRLETARHEPITAPGMAGGMEWISRGNELLLAHRYDDAVAAYDEGFRTYPSENFVLNKAAALLDGGRYAEADLAYGQYLSNPDAPRADEARAAQAKAREHMGGREASYTGVAESHRLMGQGEALYKAGDFAGALQAFDRAYALNPLAITRYNQAACMEKMGAHEMAASRYEDYLKEAPQAGDAGKVREHITKLHEKAFNLSRGAFDRAQEAYLAGNFKQAAADFIEAYSHLPKSDFLINAGQAFEMAGDKMQAVRYYQLYLNMTPNAPNADKIRAHIDELHKANGSALEKPVDHVAEAKLKLAQQAFDKGLKAYNEGRFIDAEKHFREAYAQKPFPQFLYNVAASLHKAGDTMGAVKAYQEYLNAYPDAPDADKVRKAIHILLDRVGAGLMKPGD